MLYMIIYDITNDAIRTKIADKLIEASYERLQLSVYIGLENPKKKKFLWDKLNDLLADEPEGKFYIFPIPKSSLTQMMNIGKNTLDIAYLTGDKDTLFF